MKNFLMTEQLSIGEAFDVLPRKSQRKIEALVMSWIHEMAEKINQGTLSKQRLESIFGRYYTKYDIATTIVDEHQDELFNAIETELGGPIDHDIFELTDTYLDDFAYEVVCSMESFDIPD